MSTQDKKFIYSGPSWALQSFDTPQGREPNTTSLVQEWGLAHIAHNVSARGSDFDRQFAHFVNTDLPIVYVMCEPLAVHNRSSSQKYHKFLDAYKNSWQDVWQHREELYQEQMHKLASLPNRVAVIGAHSDVSAVPDGITVIDPSWQNYLRQLAGLDTGYNWGVEILHRHIQSTTGQWRNIRSKVLVDRIYEQFQVWETLQEANLFCAVHPNRRATELYAQHTLDGVLEFIEGVK